jgi:hypothetical protein
VLPVANDAQALQCCCDNEEISVIETSMYSSAQLGGTRAWGRRRSGWAPQAKWACGARLQGRQEGFRGCNSTGGTIDSIVSHVTRGSGPHIVHESSSREESLDKLSLSKLSEPSVAEIDDDDVRAARVLVRLNRRPPSRCRQCVNACCCSAAATAADGRQAARARTCSSASGRRRRSVKPRPPPPAVFHPLRGTSYGQAMFV